MSTSVEYDVTLVFTDGTYKNKVITVNGAESAIMSALIDARMAKSSNTFYGKLLSKTAVPVKE